MSGEIFLPSDRLDTEKMDRFKKMKKRQAMLFTEVENQTISKFLIESANGTGQSRQVRNR